MLTMWGAIARWIAVCRSKLRSADMEGKIWFEGGSGESVDEAIVIRGASHDLVGTWVEFAFLDDRFGQMGRDWKRKLHGHGTYGDREVDTVRLEMPNGEQLTLYFDITESFGKWPEDYFEASEDY